ncbi:hypothetical protein D3C85_1608790 [compost metagenome]
MRLARLRAPRSTSQASSGLTVQPQVSLLRDNAAKASRVVQTLPSITSLCPPRYLVRAITEMSAPSASGWCR